MKKQILITGGVGFIGIHLVRRLIASGYFPIIIDDLSNANILQLKRIPKNHYALIRSDVNKKNYILKKLESYSPEAIVHLAAVHYIPFCIKNPGITKKINIGGTKSVLKIAKEKNIKKFIFSSSGAVYKPSLKAHRENEKLNPVDIYGKTKKASEELLLENCGRLGIDLAILRLFNIYGKFDLTPHFIPSIIARLKKSNCIEAGNLNTKRDYLYIDDLIKVFIKILKKKKMPNGIFNIGTGRTTSGKEVAELIGSMSKARIQLTENPTLKRRNDRDALRADIRKVARILKWKPKHDMRRGLKKLLYGKK